MPPGEARSVLLPVCSALAFCHARGIIHRDVKASNIFLSSDDRVVLLDFGIAKLIDAVPVGSSELRVVGTPSCTSPEQLTGGWVDERTDVYLLGCTLYHMLTGMPPFADQPPALRRALHLSAPRPRPSLRAAVPPGVDAVVMTAMSISPAARYAGPRQLARALDAALGADAAAAGDEVDALGILLETSATATGDSALAAAERALERAGQLLPPSFVPALRAANLLLVVGRLDGHPADAVEHARAALAALSERERGALSVRMRLGKVVMRDGEVCSGALVDPATWWE
jgi:serine/threonine-protein kinase